MLLAVAFSSQARLTEPKKIDLRIDRFYIIFWLIVFVGADLQKREFFYPFVLAFVQLVGPTNLTIRSVTITFMCIFSVAKEIYRMRFGITNRTCVGYLVSSGITDDIYALAANGTLTINAQTLDTWNLAYVSQTSDCTSPVVYVVFRTTLCLIFLVMGFVFESLFVKSFNMMCDLHEDKVGVLRELMEVRATSERGDERSEELETAVESVASSLRSSPAVYKNQPSPLLAQLQDFTDEQQRQLDDCLGQQTTESKRCQIKEVQFLSKLGQGNFGTVWKCTYNGRFAAVKTLNATNATPENIQRFAWEINVMERLNHPCIVSLHFAVVTPPKLCLGMELAKCDLTTCLKSGMAVPDCEAHEVGMSWHR